MSTEKTSGLLYYFPKGKVLLILSFILWAVLTIVLLDFYRYMIESVFTGIVIFIPLGLLLILAVAITQTPIKIHLWVIYIGVVFLLAVITEWIVFGRQVQLTFQRAVPVIEALELYKKNTGSYPKELYELKGKYVEQMPATAIGVFSTKEYNYYPGNGAFILVIPAFYFDMGGAYLYDSEHTERGWYYND